MNAIAPSLNLWGDTFAGIAGPLVVQSSLLILLLLVFERLFRRRVRPSIRYAVWMLVPLKLLLPPTLALPTSAAYWLSPAKTVPAMSADARPAAPSAAATAGSSARVPVAPAVTAISSPVDRGGPGTPTSTPSLRVSAWLFLVWVGGIVCLAGWVVRGHFAARRVVRASTAAPPELVELLEACCRQVGVRRRIAIRCSELASAPALCGLLSPTIVIPSPLVRLAPDALRMVIIHELAHYKRGDMWANLLLVVAQLLHWPNPLAWVAGSRIRRIREEAVDDVVLVHARGAEDTYAATLVEVARSVLSRRLPMPAGIIGIVESGSTLRPRIERVLSPPVAPSARLGRLALMATICAAFVLLPMAPGRTVVAQQSEPLVIEGMASVLDDLLLLIPHVYEQRKRDWLERVAAHPEDAAVLEGAADFLMIEDRMQAQALLERAAALEPGNGRLMGRLAQLHSLNARSTNDAAEARLALEYAEREQRLTPGISATYLKIAQIAFDAGEFSKATEYADQYLETAGANRNEWSTGDLVHKGHLVLGRIAVREGRLEDAERHLLASADTKGSPVMKSFGPNMALAKDLLEAGRPAVVLQYLEACGRFWTLNFGRLGGWASTVRAGQVPDFGANLVY